MGVKKRMRQSILVHAQHVDRHPPRFHVASNDPKGRDKGEMNHIESVLNGQNAEREAREKASIEALFTRYKGDPADLPWN